MVANLWPRSLNLPRSVNGLASPGWASANWFSGLATPFSRAHQKTPGFVTIAGAGPGDPDMLTLGTLKAMQDADVILHDALVSKAVLQHANPHAHLVPVGKRCGHHSMSQPDINALLVQRARACRHLLRLKGGDPTMFGRLVEETDALKEAHIAFRLLPGITAASGIAEQLGIPLTERDMAQEVRFVTATNLHDTMTALDWHGFGRGKITLCVYMGKGRIRALACQLLTHGASPDLPVAMVFNGTTDHQRVQSATLAQAAKGSLTTHDPDPALIIIGMVARSLIKNRTAPAAVYAA